MAKIDPDRVPETVDQAAFMLFESLSPEEIDTITNAIDIKDLAACNAVRLAPGLNHFLSLDDPQTPLVRDFHKHECYQPTQCVTELLFRVYSAVLIRQHGLAKVKTP